MGNTTDENQEHVLMADMLKQYNKLEENTWLCDSGAACHLTNDSTGVYDIIKINEMAIKGDGIGLKIIKKGKLDVNVGQNNGSTYNLTLDVKVASCTSIVKPHNVDARRLGDEDCTNNNPIKSTIEL